MQLFIEPMCSGELVLSTAQPCTVQTPTVFLAGEDNGVVH